MRRRSFVYAVCALALIGTAVAGTLAVLLRHEPAFYRQAAVPPGAERQKQSKEVLNKFFGLYDNISSKPQWSETFTEEQLNSYFEEDFQRTGPVEKGLPEGFSHPRVAIEPGRLRLAFRYGSAGLSSVVSVELRMWLVEKEPNVVALELRGLHAGLVPVSSQSLLEAVSEAARQLNLDVTWYRHEGNPVAVVRYRDEQTRPGVQLERLELRQGQLYIQGTGEAALPAGRAFPPLAAAFLERRGLRAED
jgi:hypothetical protein